MCFSANPATETNPQLNDDDLNARTTWQGVAHRLGFGLHDTGRSAGVAVREVEAALPVTGMVRLLAIPSKVSVVSSGKR